MNIYMCVGIALMLRISPKNITWLIVAQFLQLAGKAKIIISFTLKNFHTDKLTFNKDLIIEDSFTNLQQGHTRCTQHKQDNFYYFLLNIEIIKSKILRFWIRHLLPSSGAEIRHRFLSRQVQTTEFAIQCGRVQVCVLVWVKSHPRYITTRSYLCGQGWGAGQKIKRISLC